MLVVDEGSLASTAQARDLLRIANTLRAPRVVRVLAITQKRAYSLSFRLIFNSLGSDFVIGV